jgi:hypothetical protein
LVITREQWSPNQFTVLRFSLVFQFLAPCVREPDLDFLALTCRYRKDSPGPAHSVSPLAPWPVSHFAAGFVSLCGARFAQLFFAVVALKVRATLLAFGSLCSRDSVCFRQPVSAVALAADFFTLAAALFSLPPPLSQDCLVSASCCSA